MRLARTVLAVVLGLLLGSVVNMGVIALGGTLLVMCRGREADESEGNMPWPLTRAELRDFQQYGLTEIRFEDFMDQEEPPVRRLRICYARRTS